jgi:UTP--glucose-1-phosphate uridylyltransferase
VLMPSIFDHLRRTVPNAGGEIQLTDAIGGLLAEEQVLAYRYYGTRFDCGSKLGYLKATVQFALRHPEVRQAFEHYLRGEAWALMPEAPDGAKPPAALRNAMQGMSFE